jgi:uncharacterized protein (DUF169 family)
MNSSEMDLSVYQKIKSSYKPIGIKFSLTRPENIVRLEKQLSLCEMLKEAQESQQAFYTDIQNHTCGGGSAPLGLGVVRTKIKSAIQAGKLGPKLGIYKDPVANRRTLLAYPRIEKDTVNYVSFAPLDQLDFKPDVLLVTAKPKQAEIILRAYSYTSGVVWEPKCTSIIACAWLVVYPYLTGKLNYINASFSFGMVSRKLWPEDTVLLAIPSDLLPVITQNLKEMAWEPDSYKGTREENIAVEDKILEELLAENSLS